MTEEIKSNTTEKVVYAGLLVLLAAIAASAAKQSKPKNREYDWLDHLSGGSLMDKVFK